MLSSGQRSRDNIHCLFDPQRYLSRSRIVCFCPPQFCCNSNLRQSFSQYFNAEHSHQRWLQWSKHAYKVFKEGHVTVVFRERLLEEIFLRRGKDTQTCAILSEEPQEKAIIPYPKALVILSEFKDITDILEEICPSLMAEFRTKYRFALPNDEVAIIDGYNNPFKKIYCIKWTRRAEVIDIILECFQMAENDKMNSIILLIRSKWVHEHTDLTRELILGLRIFIIENPSSSIRRLYSDSEILRQEISRVTSVKVFKERHVTVVLNATYKEEEYMYELYHRHVEGRTYKRNSVVVICGVADVGQPRGNLCEHLEHMLRRDLHFQKGFTSGEVSVLGHYSCNIMRVFFGTPKLDRQDMDMFLYKCLLKADVSRVSSVTFLVPEIVRNIKLFAGTLSSCVKRFAENTPSSSIKRIYIRTERRNPNFQETKQVFEEEWAKTSGEEAPEDLLQNIDEPQEKRGVQPEVRNEKVTEPQEVEGCECIQRLSVEDFENTDRNNQRCMNDRKIEEASYIPNQHHEADSQGIPTNSTKCGMSGENDIPDRTSLGYWCLCALKKGREATNGSMILSSGVEILDKVLIETLEEINNAKLRRELYLYLSRQLFYQLSQSIKTAEFIVWPGTILNNKEMVFVLLYKGNIEEIPRRYFDKSVFYRDSEKPARNLKYPYRRPKLISNENDLLTYKDAVLIERAVEEHGEDLFLNHSNLEAISGSSFMLSMSRGYIRRPCVVLYCQVKGIAPYGERAFPKTLQIGDDTLEVDVREGFLRRGMLQPECRDCIYDKLRMGISIGAMDLNISGTLGPFVKLDGGDIGFLTCAHVVEGGNVHIVHPANGESLIDMDPSERFCGEVMKIVFNPQFREQNNGLSITVGVDAALVKVKGKRGVDIEKFPSVPPKALERAGFDPGEPPLFRYGSIQYPLDFKCVQGKRVIKYGQTTGLTKGSIQLKGGMVKRRKAELEKPNGDMVVMTNQYIVESHGGVPFFLLGDSGAGVFLVGKNNKLILIGLAIGMLDRDHCVVTPIEYVLQALDLSLKNLQFEEDMDVA